MIRKAMWATRTTHSAIVTGNAMRPPQLAGATIRPASAAPIPKAAMDTTTRTGGARDEEREEGEVPRHEGRENLAEGKPADGVDCPG